MKLYLVIEFSYPNQEGNGLRTVVGVCTNKESAMNIQAKNYLDRNITEVEADVELTVGL
jgi:hypothetical protein